VRRRCIAVLLAGATLGGAALVAPGEAAAFGPLSSFGSAGAGAGQMSSPAGMAIGPDGAAYIADVGNNHVDVFGPSGTFVRSLGKEAVPTSGGTGHCNDSDQNRKDCGDNGRGAAGVLTSPRDVAVDSAGNVFVADTGNNRVDVFAPDGSFVHAFGKGVNPAGGDDCTEASGCQRGGGLATPGGLAAPRGIAIDSSGLLYVTASLRIDVFSAAGAYLRSIGREPTTTDPHKNRNCQNGNDNCNNAEYEVAGAINAPGDIAIGADGQLFATDLGNSRIDVFGSDGSFVRAFGKGVNPAGGDVCTEATGCKKGTAGAGPGSLTSPSSLALDGAGHVFVADTSNNRIDEFGLDGTFLQAFGEGVVDGSAGFQVCAAGTGCRAGLSSATPGSISAPSGVAVDCRGAVYATEWSSGSRDDQNKNADGGQQAARVERFGETGAEPPPCSPSASPSGSSDSRSSGSKPGSHSTSGGGKPSKPTIKIELNKIGGSAVLIVIVPDPGTLLLKGKGVHKAKRVAKQEGEVEIPVVPTAAVKQKLEATGKAVVKVKLSYKAKGISSTQSLTIPLRMLNLL
jgi:hypothetical protein